MVKLWATCHEGFQLHVRCSCSIAEGHNVFWGEVLVFYGGRFRTFLAYFPSICHLFLHYFPKNSRFPTISQLFLISHLFPNYFSFPDNASRFSVTLPNYFSVISRLFPSESQDISAIYNWMISALTSRRLLNGVTVKSE